MDTEQEFFHPDAIDEQIEELSYDKDNFISSLRMLHTTDYTSYPETRDRVWRRLQQQKTTNVTHEDQAKIVLIERKRPMHVHFHAPVSRWTVIAASLIVVLLLGSVLYAYGIVQTTQLVGLPTQVKVVSTTPTQQPTKVPTSAPVDFCNKSPGNAMSCKLQTPFHTSVNDGDYQFTLYSAYVDVNRVVITFSAKYTKGSTFPLINNTIVPLRPSIQINNAKKESYDADRVLDKSTTSIEKNVLHGTISFSSMQRPFEVSKKATITLYFRLIEPTQKRHAIESTKLFKPIVVNVPVQSSRIIQVKQTRETKYGPLTLKEVVMTPSTTALYIVERRGEQAFLFEAYDVRLKLPDGTIYDQNDFASLQIGDAVTIIERLAFSEKGMSQSGIWTLTLTPSLKKELQAVTYVFEILPATK